MENRTRTGGVESETAPAASITLAYGDWYEAESVNVTVTDISTDEVQITMCGRDGGCAVRWEPASKRRDCPG